MIRKETSVRAAIAVLGLTTLFTPGLYAAGSGRSVLGQAAPSAAADRAALLNGVDAVRAPGGLSATLTLLGDSAFPLITGMQSRDRAPVVAASRTGRGRVVVYGHGNFIGRSGLGDKGTARLLVNAVRWSAAGRTGKAASLRVGLLDQSDATETLTAAGFTPVPLTEDGLTAAGLAAVDVLLCDTSDFAGPKAGSGRLSCRTGSGPGAA
jgi:hypothetical protein